MNPNHDWTPERTEMVATLWAEGYSASEIADKMGGLTRNAVLGKVHRMGIATRSSSRPRKTAAKKSKPRLNVYTGRVRSERDQPMAPLPLPPEPTPTGELVSLAALEPHQCRFPFGEPSKPGFGFCGCTTVPGASYCEAHFKVCYTQYIPRRGQEWGEVSRRIQAALKVAKEGVE